MTLFSHPRGDGFKDRFRNCGYAGVRARKPHAV